MNKLFKYLEESHSQIALEKSNTKRRLEVPQIVNIFLMQFCVLVLLYLF